MKLKKIILLLIFFVFVFGNYVYAADINKQVSVPAAILVERNTNRILYEKNINEKRYPASLTKVMTAIVVLENCSIYEKTTVSFDAVNSIPAGYSVANLAVGEELTIEQLLHILLMESASDAANALAEHVAGSVPSFASIMNTKAAELGCKNTHFVNPDGQHSEEHYSTINDLCIIANYAMNNETFKSIVSKNKYVIYPTNKHDSERLLTNTNYLLNPSSEYYYKNATGIKTGFTTPAGNCLMASATDNNLDLLVVVLGGFKDENNQSQRYSSTVNLLNYGFENFTYKNLRKKGDCIKVVEIPNATEETKNLKVLVAKDISVFMNKENADKEFTYTLNLNENLFAPIAKNSVIGNITYEIDGITYSSDLVAASNVDLSENSILFIIICILILMIAIFIYTISRYSKRKH